MIDDLRASFDSALESIRDELEDAVAFLTLYYFGRKVLAVLVESCKNGGENRPGLSDREGDHHLGGGNNER